MNVKPLSNHVFLEALEEEKTTASGIVLPDTAEKEKPVKGKVLAVGPGKVQENGTVRPVAVNVGDVVLFKKYGPDEIEIEGKKYLVGDEDDILAVLE
ncbi:MAG TPA: co-chaperone GroES [Candidatus Paceibacterota bacterium]|nr:co-chaperone GroES [Candidatus Paceibacterota bacterium]